jgi:hypothetical protein
VMNVSVLERTDIIKTVIVINWLDIYDRSVHFYKGIVKCITYCYIHLIKGVSDRELQVLDF